jgi:hypothetical protein
MAEEIDPEVSKLERDALLDYLAKERQNLDANKLSWEETSLPPNWREFDLNDPRLAGSQEYIEPDFSTEEGMTARGFFDEKGEATQLGKDYLLLEDRGLVQDGKLTAKGEAFTTSLDEITDPSAWLDSGMSDDALDEKKAELLAIRKKSGIDAEPERTWTEAFKEFGAGLASVGKGALDIAGNMPTLATPVNIALGREESISEKVSESAEVLDKFIEGSTVGSAKLARFLSKGAVAAAEATGILTPEEADKYNKKRDLGLAYVERAQKDIDSAEVASIVGLGEQVTKSLDRSRNEFVSQYGEDEGSKKFQENLNNIGAATQVAADPIGLALGGLTAGAGVGLNIIRAARVANQAKKGISIINHGRELNAARVGVAANAAKLADEASIVSSQLDDALRIGATEKAAELTTKLDNLTAQSQAVQTRLGIIDDGIANVSKTVNQLEIGLDTAKTAKDAIRASASRATGALANGAESIGNFAVKTNNFIKNIERKVGFSKIPWIIRAGLSVPYSEVLVPYLAGRIALAAAPPVLNKMANFGRVMSEEMLERTSSTPFFRRVAANESIGGLGRAVATLGDYSTPLAKGFASMAKGTSQAAPATFSYNAINSQGVDENTLKYAARDALVFGSLGRVLGSKKDIEKVNVDQMTNYRNKLDADQIAVFDGLKDRDFRYALSGIDAAYPGMFKWEIKTTGNNLFDPGNRRAVVNINDKTGFLKEVAMHETGHMIQHVWQNDAMIVSRMLGDDTQPGLVRNQDGTLDSEFKAWADEYNNLREQNDLAPADLNELAIEYYTEQGVQTLLDDVLKGKMYKEARKTPLRRAVENSFRTVFNATPIVKNLHFKLGGATDATGRMVMGTGLLADGFRELPEVKSMVRQMYRETSGKPKAMRPQKIVDVASENPKHYEANTVIDEVNKQLVERGEKLPEGALVPDKNGNGEGILTDDYFKTLEERGVIDEGDYSKASFFQAAMDAPQKHGVLLVNKPIAQGRSEQFGGLAEGYVIPTKWILKKGRLYVESMDLRQLDKNVDRAVKNKIAKELGMTRKKIYEDIERSVELQNKGQASDGYYQSVDPQNWRKRKNFINSVLGLQTNRQLGINPMMKKVSPDLVTGIYRTFAFDRIQSVIRSGGDVVIPFGQNSYYSIRDNLLPQTPRFNRNGDLVPEKTDLSNVRYMPKQMAQDYKRHAELESRKSSLSAKEIKEATKIVESAAQEAGFVKFLDRFVSADYIISKSDLREKLSSFARKYLGARVHPSEIPVIGNRDLRISDIPEVLRDAVTLSEVSKKLNRESDMAGNDIFDIVTSPKEGGTIDPVTGIDSSLFDLNMAFRNKLRSDYEKRYNALNRIKEKTKGLYTDGELLQATSELPSLIDIVNSDTRIALRRERAGESATPFESAELFTGESLSKRFGIGSNNIKYMPSGSPKGKPKATRLASELAKRAKVPLSKVHGSGADGSITPNDVRSYIASQEGKLKPLAFQKEPPMAVDPSISDLVGSEVQYQGRIGTIVDDNGRPALQDADGVIYELPFGYFTDQGARELGVRPTGKRVIDKNNLIKEFEETSRQELRDIFGYIDDITDKIADLAELGSSVKRTKGRKSELVRETDEFQQYVRGVTNSQILHAWERTEKALERARKSKNANNEDIQTIISHLEGNIRNIEKLAEAIDILKQQRATGQVAGQKATTKVTGPSQSDLMAQMEVEARAAEAKRRSAATGRGEKAIRPTGIAQSYRGGGQKYRNPMLARSISLAISGQSREREQTK